jgi:hypothetical protein
MNRRKALLALAGGTSTLAIPGWIARAFAQSVPADAPCETASRHGSVTTGTTSARATSPRLPNDIPSALRRAESAGKPLLVLVVPDDTRDLGERGLAFGELINHGGDSRLALLALCEVMCAHMGDLRHEIPEIGAGDPLMVLVETDGSRPRFHRMDGSLPSVAARESRDVEVMAREEDRVIDQRIEFLGDLLESTLAPDAGTLNRRAAQARAHLAPPESAAIDSRLAAHQVPPVPLTDRAAAIVLAASRARAADRDVLLARLREAANSRVRDHRVPGSRWAHSGGCGTTYEDEDTLTAFGCGMGHIAARSQRFLDFLAAEATRTSSQGS